MTLRLKIHLLVAALMLAFVAAVLGLQLRGMKESVREEVLAANRVAAQLLNRTAWLYAAQGVPALQAFLQGLGRVRANDIELLDRSGSALYTSPPSPYKAGRDAPDWFARLIGPPPSVQAIDFPDGKLVVRGNASRAVLDAWDSLIDQGAVALGLLLAANALVFWLVGRAVRPFGQVVAALNSVQGGRLDVSLPALPGREANRMAEAFNRMVTDLREHVETEKRAVRAEKQLSDSRELTRWIDQHIEQERRMIARELHDELGQSVTAMKSLALGIAQRARGRDDSTEQAARLVAEEATRLYDAMHGIIPRLTPLVLDNFGLADALTDLVARTRQAHPQVALELQVDLKDTPLAAEAALALYRAAQEGITNALRHGPATRLALQVQADADAVELALTDNGRGPPPDWARRQGHYGLGWLAERAQSLQGSLVLEPAAPQGARLRMRLPLPGTAQHTPKGAAA
ncbi:signal transduction histidine kinase, glucose-6-phosphate specific [Burkholderiales bacterium JOSHI_001]|nr:signal transduction histidine kinase, glucose-6-phosphate specific [Burkholderiales bacterium JOSHI_001]